MALYYQGSRGPAVEKIQKQLNSQIKKADFKRLIPDGIFGALTKAAVEQFQRENPPLVVDGIVGDNTMAKLNSGNGGVATFPKELTIIDNTAGQAPSPSDCGYFCGFAAAQHWHNGGHSAALGFTQQDVYAARDAFEKIDGAQRGQPGFGNVTYLTNKRAPAFLESLKVFGYQDFDFSAKDVNNLDDQAFAQELKKATGNGRNGIMISGSDHWIAALDVTRINEVDYVRVYDPGGGVPNQVRAVTPRAAGRQLCWMECFDFQMYLSGFMKEIFGRAGIVKK